MRSREGPQGRRLIGPSLGETRRWPDRRLSRTATVRLTPSVELDCQIRGEGVDDDAKQWLGYHAARVSFGALWRDAQARTSAVAHSGVAAWADVTPRTAWWDSAWLARATPHGVQFIAPVTSSWLGAPYSSKCLRRARYRTRQQTRFDSMWEEARGACLSWSEIGGWQVIDALVPANHDVCRRC
jgi:hypothetical protein